MINLENMLIWDDELSPTRVPRITIDPVKWSSLKAEEKWIIVGKWKIRINVEPSGNSFKLTSQTGKIIEAAMSGSMFIDQSMFEITTASDGAHVLGRASGCFDISWP